MPTGSPESNGQFSHNLLHDRVELVDPTPEAIRGGLAIDPKNLVIVEYTPLWQLQNKQAELIDAVQLGDNDTVQILRDDISLLGQAINRRQI